MEPIFLCTNVKLGATKNHYNFETLFAQFTLMLLQFNYLHTFFSSK
jgi:hypothetical protein